MELTEAEQWLEGLINVERMPDFGRARLGLEAIEALLARVGHPQRGLRVFHVAGSKGKGSTALLAEAIAMELGARVATFTSPHLVRWTERFRIDGREVDGQRLASVLTRLRPHVDALRQGPHPPSFFDATTAAAFLLFAEADVDVAILEVGLGGRLDSTNACEPAVTAITSIELEHTEKLGDTHAAIAAEKAGIVKRGVPLVLGELPDEAHRVAIDQARARNAPVVEPGRDYTVQGLESGPDQTRFRWRAGELGAEFTLPVAGEHQARNAAVALEGVRRLGLAPDEAVVGAAGRAFASVRLPGRIEVLGRGPWRIVDGAHTAVSARQLAGVLGRIERERSFLVLSISLGKDLDAICEALAPFADQVTVTRAEPVRAHASADVVAALRRAAPQACVEVDEDPVKAVAAANDRLGPRDLLCATGSIYLAGIAREVLTAS